MLRRIPEIPSRLDTMNRKRWDPDYNPEIDEYDDDYFDSIESRLATYENLQEVAPTLELALWRAKINEQSDGNLLDKQMKLQCRCDSLFLFANINRFLWL